MFKKIWPFLATTLILISTFVSNAPPLIAVASIIGVIFVLGAAYKKNWAPLLGAVLSVLYAILSYQVGYFSNAAMNLFILVPLQLWGVWFWYKNGDKTFQISRMWKWIALLLTVLGSLVSIYFAYIRGSNLPIADGISATLIITGTVLLTLKTKEQWFYWIPYNLLECGMWFLAMSAEPSVIAIFVMRIVFFFNSLFAIKEWFKK